MPAPHLPPRVFRIHRRTDGRYETRNEVPTDSPLGVDLTLGLAIGTATREATLASSAGYRVIIEIEQPNGGWKQNTVIDPPSKSIAARRAASTTQPKGLRER